MNIKQKLTITLLSSFSQSHRTGWALQQAAFYAPELSFVGASMGGLPVNIEHIFNNVNAGLFAGIAAAGIAGLLKTRPELADLFHNVHNYTGILDTLEASCITDMVAKFANFNFYTLAGINRTELYESQPLKAVFDSLILGGNETTTPPNLIIQVSLLTLSPLSLSSFDDPTDSQCPLSDPFQFLSDSNVSLPCNPG